MTVKYGKIYIKDKLGNISEFLPQAQTVPNYTGATTTAAGIPGLVPGALSSERNNFLKADGTWAEVDLSSIISDLNAEISARETAISTLTDRVDDIEELAGAAYHFKGTVTDVNALPVSGNEVGDVWNIGSSLDGDNYAWTGTNWDKLGGTVDLSAYATKAEIPVSIVDISDSICEYDCTEELPITDSLLAYINGYTQSQYEEYQSDETVTGQTISITSSTHNGNQYVVTFSSVPYAITIELSIWNNGHDDITSNFSFYNSNDEDIDLRDVQIPLITLSDIINAGENGIELYKNFGTSDGDKLFVTCENTEENTYTFTFLWRNYDTVPKLTATMSDETTKEIKMPCIPSLVDEKIENALSTYALDDNVVHKFGDETITGVKTFNKNWFENVSALTGNQVDVSEASFFTKTITTDTTLSFTGVPTGKAAVFTLMLTNGGAYDVTFPNNVVWYNGEQPELQETGTDSLTFFTPDGGTTWYNTDVVIPEIPEVSYSMTNGTEQINIPTPSNQFDGEIEPIIIVSE